MIKRLLLVAGMGLFAVTQTAAQVPGVGVNIFPRVGVFRPSGELCECNNFDVKLRGGFAVGLSAEFGLPLLPDIRASLDYAPRIGTTVDGTDSPESDNSLLALTADLVVNLSPPLSPIKPYALLGGGFKRYDISSLGSTSGETDPTFHAGVGLSIGIGKFSLAAEASDYISWFNIPEASDGKLQNDIFIMAGIRIGFF
jgi:hypothetical protein